MNFSFHLNSTIGSCIIIILITADYLRKYNTDNFQRKLLMIVFGAIFISSAFDYIGLTLERSGGTRTNLILYIVWSAYMLARNCGYYYAAVFIDYFAHGNPDRTKNFFKIVSVFLVLFAVSIIANLRLGYFFYISRDNIYIPGTFYLLQILLSYFPILIIMIDISLASKHIKQTQVFLMTFFVLITAVGAALDIISEMTSLIWPCATAALLYMYFFIIRSESKIDSLTGIGSRSSFNEYILKLSKQTVRKDYVFVMLDLDRFKEINDTLGYLEGDNALRDIAAIIKGYTRHTDFAARFGGDEFIMVTTAENDIQNIIDRINKAIDTQNKLCLRPYQLYISYGYGVYTTNSGQSIQNFIAVIDKKMYQYKESRREILPSAITANLKEKFLNNGENDV